MRRALLIFLLLLFALPAHGGETFVLPARSAATLGENRAAVVAPRETLMELAWREGVGFRNVVAANPDCDPWLPPAGAKILLPTAVNVPPDLGTGITINLAEFRLYYLWMEEGIRKVRIYPVGIGSEGWNTPEGKFTIAGKTERPAWTVPPSIRAEKPYLPARVPPGPENPLGDYWLELSLRGYGIHGTNKPLGVGRRVSHGCIRMYPEDIRDLYGRVERGTPVRIVYQPIKLARNRDQLLLEVHADFLGKIDDPVREVVRQKRSPRWSGPLHLRTLQAIVEEARGIPTPLLFGRPDARQ
jgi:L,D-transpeptidase ErfK/SrfK